MWVTSLVRDRRVCMFATRRLAQARLALFLACTSCRARRPYLSAHGEQRGLEGPLAVARRVQVGHNPFEEGRRIGRHVKPVVELVTTGPTGVTAVTTPPTFALRSQPPAAASFAASFEGASPPPPRSRPPLLLVLLTPPRSPVSPSHAPLSTFRLPPPPSLPPLSPSAPPPATPSASPSVRRVRHRDFMAPKLHAFQTFAPNFWCSLGVLSHWQSRLSDTALDQLTGHGQSRANGCEQAETALHACKRALQQHVDVLIVL